LRPQPSRTFNKVAGDNRWKGFAAILSALVSLCKPFNRAARRVAKLPFSGLRKPTHRPKDVGTKNEPR
jgi:hypothetical protein